MAHQTTPHLSIQQSQAAIATINQQVASGKISHAAAQGMIAAILDMAQPREPGQTSMQRVNQMNPTRRERLLDSAQATASVASGAIDRGKKGLQAMSASEWDRLVEGANE